MIREGQTQPPQDNDPINSAVTTEDLQWFDTASKIFAGREIVFRQQPLTIFQELIQRAQRGEIFVNDIFDFIDPRNIGPVQGYSQLQTLGYFVNQEAPRFSGLVSKVKLSALLERVDVQRMAILSAAGARDPNVWSADHEVTLKPGIPEESSVEGLVEQYVYAVEALFELLESFTDLDTAIRYFKVKVFQYRQAVITKVGPNGKPVSDDLSEMLSREIPTLEAMLERLKQKKSL